MSFKPEVQVIGEEGHWHANGLRFATREEAEASARDLAGRWTLVIAHRASESEDPVNYHYVDGKLIDIEAERRADAAFHAEQDD